MPRAIKNGDAAIGERIKARRVMLGISQTTLAKKCGISFQQIQKYENGKNGLHIGRMKLIAAALDVPPIYFLGDDKSVAQDNIKLVLSPAAAQMLAAFNNIKPAAAQRRLIELAEMYADAPAPRK